MKNLRLSGFKQDHPRVDMVKQALIILFVSTELSLVLIAPLYVFDIEEQIIIDFFTYPYDLIPIPYNFFGFILISLGFLFIVWANYHLLHIGKIGLANREPMQRPSTLVLSGPYRLSRIQSI